MTKIPLAIALFGSVLLVTPVQAGFWGSMAGGAIGSAASSSGAVSSSRMKKANNYLWNMYKSGKYEEGYQFYLNYLEQSESISHLDTVAKIYKANGNQEKAIEIYEKRILPWVAIENSKTRNKFLGYYNNIKEIDTSVQSKNGTTLTATP